MVLAIDVGGTKFACAVFDGTRMVEKEVCATDRAGGRDWMLRRLEVLIASWNTKYKFSRCGVGFGGPVDFAKQKIVMSTHVAGWMGFDLPAFVEALIKAPVLMDRDTLCGALGEGLFGAGRGYRPLFYMTLSTGIGGGILAEDDRIWRGPDSYAGELGHMTIRPEGPDCLCGARGCLERMCCGLWLERDYGKTAKELMEDASFVQRYVVDVALGLKAVIMLLNPARIVIGGGIGKAGERLFVPLRAELGRQLTSWSRARVDVVPAELGDDSVLYGALALK